MFGFLNNVMNFADANKFFTNGFQNIMKFNPFDFQNYFNNSATSNTQTQNNEPSKKDDTVKTEAKNEEINKLASQIDELKSQISKLNKEKIN